MEGSKVLARSAVRARPSWLRAGGEAAELIARLSPRASALGAPEDWPAALRVAVNTLLETRYPMFVAWGEGLPYLYNDACIPIVGDRHPFCFGRPFEEAWPDAWAALEPFLRRALAGETVYHENLPLTLDRQGRPEEAHFTFCYSPLRDETGEVRGVLSIAMETTETVRSERRRAFLDRLEERLHAATDPAALVGAATALLGEWLDVKRCGWGEVDSSGEMLQIVCEWCAPGLTPFSGKFRLNDYGRTVKSLRDGGAAVCIEDALADDRLDPAAASARVALGVRASLTMPLWRSDRVVAHLYLVEDRPRAWTEYEVALAREVMERTWAAAERARAETALRRSEQELRIVTDALPVLISNVDRHERYQFNNQAYEDWFGLARDDIRGRSILEVLGPAAYEKVKPLVDRALSGERFSFERVIPYARGGTRHVRADYIPHRDDEGAVDGYVALIQDITEQKAAEQALRESEERLRLAAEAARIGTWDMDLRTQRGRWDAMALRIAGIPDSDPDYDGETWLRVVHPDDQKMTQEAFLSSLEPDGPAYNVVFRSAAETPTGEPRWINSLGAVYRDPATGAAMRSVGIMRDITDERRANERLRTTVERLEAAEQAIGAIIYDSVDGRVWRSTGLTRVTGWDETELGEGAVTWLSLMHPDDRRRLDDFESVLGEDDRYSTEYRILSKNGHYVWLMDRGQVQRDETGAVRRLIGASFDIDDRKRAEEHRELLVAELNHRVKNTLAVVQGLAQQSYKGEPVSDQARQAFEGRLAALAAAHDILTRESWESADVGEVVRQTLWAHAAQGRYRIAGPPLRLRPKLAVAMAMALHELCTNATKYGSLSVEGGTVSVRWEITKEPEPRFNFRWEEKGGPEVVPPRRRGFGSRLVERALAAELEGSVALDYRAEGLVCLVNAPVPDDGGREEETP